MKRVVLLLVAALTLGCVYTAAHAQETSENTQVKQPAEQNAGSDQHARTPVQAFRLDFAFYELEEGKKINTRRYSLDLTSGSHNQLRIGTRVPVPLGTDGLQYQYMDVGTKIWASLGVEGGGDLRLDVTSDISNLDATQSASHAANVHPVVRQVEINGTTLLTVGKPIAIGSVDDPNSNRQFQLEVTATKLR
jgi:hypothetical protein